VEPSDLAASAGGKIKARAVSGANELGGHKENLFAQGMEGGILKLRR